MLKKLRQDYIEKIKLENGIRSSMPKEPSQTKFLQTQEFVRLSFVKFNYFQEFQPKSTGIFEADVSLINKTQKIKQPNTARHNFLMTGNFDINAIPRAIREIRKMRDSVRYFN